ncbi:GNAT family N-acetyltransferase [Serratia rubidaea]|uniref:GNAT family N-acetyltransferase n=1 Tax=Serratia rubidaea TaxID=61652 RepID=UPI00177C442B|nr:GNAT family N-acetyltransferase [Serratia rubidaea]MBD8451235.1 GNAT family N-acetyltransferase [Serratia rubidaea]
MKIEICQASDIPELARVFVEMDSYYFDNEGASYDEMISYLTHRVFSAYSGVTILGAWKNGILVGFATFTVMFPAPKCSGQVYMKDLFTSAEVRGQGVGKSLMGFIAAFAIEHGCMRFDWTAETTNPKAAEFYLSLGASLIEEKQYFRLEHQNLATFAMQNSQS